MRILVDAMGGDNAPEAIVTGCMDAIRETAGLEIELIGDLAAIKSILERHRFHSDRLILTHSTEVIRDDDTPTAAIKNKTDSSMVKGFCMLREGQGSAFISAGSTGALLAGSLLIIGRLEGVQRPALGAVIPTARGQSLLIDAGLNSECKPENYLQFARFGAAYMNSLYDLKQPTIGLINIGSEEGKGTPEVKGAHELLRCSTMAYHGSIEGNHVIEGLVDVMLCNGFVGNVLLKFLEGNGKFFFHGIRRILYKNLLNKMSGLILKRDLKNFAGTVDPDLHGGAPVLGIRALVMKSHGSSSSKAIKNVILKAKKLSEQNVVGTILHSLGMV